MKWENVYVFISSTFNDMHAERDHLVKKVFPELSEWCAARKLRLMDIDLRWGVTEADSRGGRVVEACLNRINECRPFFLCFLGQRRGWVPRPEDIDPATGREYPDINKYAGNSSVTEMEMTHALTSPLKSSTAGDFSPCEHALFFLRQDTYLSDIAFSDTKAIYTNSREADPAAADAELKRWKEQLIPQTHRPCFEYSATWNASLSTPETALPLTVPTTAEPGTAAFKAACASFAAMWKRAGVSADENGEFSPAELEKATAYNKKLTAGRLTGFTVQGETLAEAVISQLKRAITERFGEREAEAETPLQRELAQQEQFMQSAAAGYIRRGQEQELADYINDDDRRTLYVTALPGTGKTSLLADFTARYDESALLCCRFCGAGDQSVSLEGVLRSLLWQLKAAGRLKADIPISFHELLTTLPELMKQAAAGGKVIWILDAADQLEGGAGCLDMLPVSLPEGFKLIASFKRGEPEAEALYDRLKGGARLLEVRPFAGEDDRRRLVDAYLSNYFKELDAPRISSLIGCRGADNPLFLKVALSELRVFGVHSALSTLIENAFGDTPASAFSRILERLEGESLYFGNAKALISHVFGLLACSKYGLTAEELAQLLVANGVYAGRDEALDDIHVLPRQGGRSSFVKPL